jgi:hypothetical protein
MKKNRLLRGTDTRSFNFQGVVSETSFSREGGKAVIFRSFTIKPSLLFAGILVMVYTNDSGVWYKLSVGPAAMGNREKHLFTLHKWGI